MDLGSRSTHFLHPEITLVILFHCAINKSPGSIVVNPGTRAPMETSAPFFFPDTASAIKVHRRSSASAVFSAGLLLGSEFLRADDSISPNRMSRSRGLRSGSIFREVSLEFT
jgi:hypothetical protein